MKTGKICCIYKITSPTGAIYIGQTVNFSARKRSYKNLFCKSQRRLYNSLLSHGYESHLIETIEMCSCEDLNEREKYWISFFDSCRNGMNLNYGGNSFKMSEETKRLISAKRKLNQTGIIGRKGKEHYNYGKRMSENDKIAFRLSHANSHGGKKNGRFKGFIIAYKDGLFVGEYEGVHDAAAKLHLQHPNISKVILGKRLTTGGYTFKRLAA